MRRFPANQSTLLCVFVACASLAAGACKPDLSAPAPASASDPASVSASASASASASTSVSASASDTHAPPGPWFHGTVEQAFSRARAERLQVFLYWGAAWCPPCNELKATVFAKPRFAELMNGFVPVYLDGDTAEAQRWAEELDIAAYPTVLVLSAEREELFRVNGSVDMSELEAALGVVRGKSEGLSAAIKRLEANTLLPEDARLFALTAWELLPEEAFRPPRLLSILSGAVARCPPAMVQEKAILASSLLSIAVENRRDKSLADALRPIEAEAGSHFDTIFHDEGAIWASRSFVNYRAADISAWLFPDPLSDGYKRLRDRWLKAAASIRSRAGDVSVDVRLSTWNPVIELFRHEEPKGAVPEHLRADVIAAVRRADEEARSAYERHAVVSTAGHLLRQVGAHEEARRLLTAEAERTDTPWYYYSSLSALEQELGRKEEARSWSKKARESAKGRASRLQWITNDIVLNAKLAGSDQRGYLLSLAEEFYALATSLSDGFSGRNKGRAGQVQKALAPFRGDPEFARLIARYAGECDKLAGEGKESCRKHFEQAVR